MYGGGPLALSLPILAQSLQVLRPREDPRRPLQGRSSRQELRSGHLRPHLGTERRVCQAHRLMGETSRLMGESSRLMGNVEEENMGTKEKRIPTHTLQTNPIGTQHWYLK